ncbi:MAG: hypothetical protein IJ794_09245, partial [Lachnospiraceae bacterium]|nr:hypothetical protein [Lachnospiraceae bacterium]
NPWKELTEEELVKATGRTFRLPAEAQNVHYSYMESEGIVEAVFEWEALDFTVRRKQESGFEDISGMYYDWVIQNDVKIGTFVGKEFTAFSEQKTVKVCMWYDTEEELMYSLSVMAADLNGFDIRALAERLSGLDSGEESTTEQGEETEIVAESGIQ